MSVFVAFSWWCDIARRLKMRQWQDRVMLRWQYAAKNDFKRTMVKYRFLVTRLWAKFPPKLLVKCCMRSRQQEAVCYTNVRSHHHGIALHQEGRRVTVSPRRITVFKAQSVKQNSTVLCDLHNW